MSDAARRIQIGYVRRAHGIRGEVVVRCDDADRSRFSPGVAFLTDDDPPRELVVDHARRHRGEPLVAFEGIDDRNAAESLRGVSLTIDVAERRRLDPDEYWPEDLVGLRMVDTAGLELGTITGVVLGAAQDRLVVSLQDGGAADVPFVDALVGEIDLERGVVVADLPEGLL